MSETRKLVERFWKALESNELEDLAGFVDSDCHFKMPGAELTGLASIKPLLAAYATAFPDMKHRVKHAIESDDAIALELEVTGTHTGPMPTPQGPVAPTGAKVVWESCDYIRFRNGKISSWHGYFDSVPFLSALGLLPSR